jgi:lipid-binding SYLF domain-containing protein
VNPNAVERFSKGNFTVGVDASVAAGPIGRDAQAGTDYKLDSEIYSYSKAKGLFAGIVIQGTALTVDKSNNKKVYGDVTTDRILKSDGHRAPALVTTYVNALERYAH